MFPIIDRLLFKETFKTLLVILLVLAVVFISNSLVRLLSKVAGGAFSSDVLLLLVMLEYLKVIGFLIPPAFFFSMLWVLGRMHQGSEMTALGNAGVGDWRLFRSLMLTAVPLALIVTWLMLGVMPWAKAQTLEIRYQQKKDPSIGLLRAGRFNEFKRGELTFFAEGAAADGSELQRVFVQHGGTEQPTILLAERARIAPADDGDGRMVVLKDGVRYEGTPGEVTFQISRFSEFGIRIPSRDVERGDSLTARGWRQLWGSEDVRDQAELQRRLVIPLAVFAFTLLGIPLSRTSPRRGVYGRIGIAIVLYFVFMNLLRLSERWMVDGVTPAWLGMWWLPLATALVAVLVMGLNSNRFARHTRAWMPGWLSG